MAIAGFALFVMGIIFMIVAPINRRKNARCSAQTQGTLREVWERENSEGSAGHTYVYSYQVNGIEYQMKSVNRSPQANKVGDPCTIWYNPAKPKDAQPFHYDSGKVYTIILILGIVMLLLGIFLTLFGLAR